MFYAIIAAGNGSRLAQEGIAEPKPLVKVNGECLIDRLVRIFSENDAERIFIICNEEMTAVQEHILRLADDYPIELVVKSTPSSMHSLHELSKRMGRGIGKFVLTTVDTIFNKEEFARYVREFAASDADGMMGLTAYIDDEKPLYASIAEDRITGYYDTPSGCRHISAGIYGLSADCFAILDNCIAKGESRMRNFQRALVGGGKRLAPFLFSQVFDIDHKADIAKAEQPHPHPSYHPFSIRRGE